MLKAVNGTTNVYEVPQTETEQVRNYNISYRGASDLERVPEDGDIYESPAKKKGGGKVARDLVGIAVAASGIAAYVKGNKAGAEGFFKKIGEGYKQMGNSVKGWITKKGKDVAEETATKGKDKEIEAAVEQVFKNAEKEANRLPEARQAAENARLTERNLANKSAEESAAVFKEHGLTNTEKKIADDAAKKAENALTDKILNIRSLDDVYAIKDEVMKNGTETQKELLESAEALYKA